MGGLECLLLLQRPLAAALLKRVSLDLRQHPSSLLPTHHAAQQPAGQWCACVGISVCMSAVSAF